MRSSRRRTVRTVAVHLPVASAIAVVGLPDWIRCTMSAWRSNSSLSVIAARVTRTPLVAASNMPALILSAALKVAHSGIACRFRTCATRRIVG